MIMISQICGHLRCEIFHKFFIETCVPPLHKLGVVSILTTLYVGEIIVHLPVCDVCARNH